MVSGESKLKAPVNHHYGPIRPGTPLKTERQVPGRMQSNRNSWECELVQPLEKWAGESEKWAGESLQS